MSWNVIAQFLKSHQFLGRVKKNKLVKQSLEMLSLEDRQTPASLYVAPAASLTITIDQGEIGSLDAGDTVKWNAVDGLIFGTDAFTSIQTAVDAAAAGDKVYVAAGTYAEAVTIDKPLSLLGNNSGRTGNGSRLAESVIVPTAVVSSNPDASDLVRVTSNGVTVDGFALDGSNPALGSVGVPAGSGFVQGRYGLTNIAADNSRSAISNLTVRNNIIRNLAGDGVSLDFDGLAGSANSIVNNRITGFGWSGPTDDSAYAGIYLGYNAAATISGNAIVDTAGGTFGVLIYNTDRSSLISKNSFSVGQGSVGFATNLFSTGTLTLAGNIFNAASGVAVADASIGVSINSVLGGGKVVITHSAIGTSGGTFSRGIEVWNAGNVSIDDSSIRRANIGIAVDAYVDADSFGAGKSSVKIDDTAISPISGGSALRLIGTPAADSFAVSGGTVKFADNTVKFSDIGRVVLDGLDGGDSYAINLGTGPRGVNYRIDDTGSAASGSDKVTLYGTTGADSFNVNSAIKQTVLFGNTGESVSYTSALEQLTIQGAPSGAKNDRGDTFTVAPDATTAITLNAGNPTSKKYGDKVILSLAGLTSPSYTTTSTGALTSSNKATVNWTGIETVSVLRTSSSNGEGRDNDDCRGRRRHGR